MPGGVGPGAFPGVNMGLGTLGQMASPAAAPGLSMGPMPGLGGMMRPPGMADGGDPDDDIPASHREYLARRGIETASPDLSPTATGADIKGEALGMVDPFGLPSAAAGRLSPGLGQTLEGIKQASPAGYGAGEMMSPFGAVPANLMGKGIGLASRGAQAFPKTAQGLGAAGALAAGTASAGDQPTGRPDFTEQDKARLAELDAKIKQTGLERDKFLASKQYAAMPLSAKNAQIASFKDAISSAQAEMDRMRSSLAQKQAEYDLAGQPTSIAHPGAVLAARAGGLGASGILGSIAGWKGLPFVRSVAGGAGAAALGALAPTGYDLMAPPGTEARRLAEASFSDPDFYKRVGIDTGIGALEGAFTHEAGHVLGTRSRRKAAAVEPPAIEPPQPTAPAGQAAQPAQPAPPAKGKKQWPASYKDIDMFYNKDAGRFQEVGTGHWIPKGLEPPRAGINAPAANQLPAEAHGGGIGYAAGGNPIGATPYYARAEARSLGHVGPVIGSSLGRGDSKSLSVPGGSYVLPASHVSALGQGNTLAGHSVLSSMFSGGPFGTSMPRGGRGGGPPKPPRMGAFADGGSPKTGSSVPIMISDGEHVLSPEEVAAVDRYFGGSGDVDRGHRILDAWVEHERKKHVKELKSLPGPAKD